MSTIVVVGAGLAGLVATHELVRRGHTVTLLDAGSRRDFGGQAFWSLGGLFMVNTPEQRLTGIRDSAELAWADWEATAGFDRDTDDHGREAAQAYVQFAAGPMREWLHGLGLRWFPSVGWAERGGSGPAGPGNSVPRFHITWGTGPGVLEPFARSVGAAIRNGHVDYRPGHRLTGLHIRDGGVRGVQGSIVRHDGFADRGQPPSSHVVGEFDLPAQAVVVATGGMGGNLDLVKKWWPTELLGPAPGRMLMGTPAHVDGSGLLAAQRSGVQLRNTDRMWHYTEGLQNYAPIWNGHGIRILPGPSALWLNPAGTRLPAPYFPGNDTLGTLSHLRAGGFDASWLVASAKVVGKEWALSGSEQNPDLTGRSVRKLAGRLGRTLPGPVGRFVRQGADFVTATTARGLVDAMAALSEGQLDTAAAQQAIIDRDAQVHGRVSKDPQIHAMRGARAYVGERLLRTAPPSPWLDGKHDVIAARVHLLTRKTLGGLATTVDARALDAKDEVIEGLFAVGEAAGFGGGGVHGYRSLEGTFLGGCLFTGRQAAHAISAASG